MGCWQQRPTPSEIHPLLPMHQEHESMLAYSSIPFQFGTLTVSWATTVGERAPVRRIYLPTDRLPHEAAAMPGDPADPPEPVADLLHRLERYLAGHPVTFDLEPLDLSTCTPFQQRVLCAEFAIPRGEVTTYGLLAAHIGAPRAARAVGTALGSNPFPVVIPCHRAVHADGTLGGFRGGLPMKRALLEMEGITFSARGAVRVKRYWYAPSA
jgi:O-6-methylguanine DNA methyltransferase